MKFFAVAFNVLFLFGVVVFASPSSAHKLFKATDLRHDLFNEKYFLNRMEASIRAIDVSQIIDQFECIIGALGTVSENNGLEAFWSSFRSQFKSNIAEWRQCSNKQGLLYYLCNIKQGYVTYKLAVQYAESAAEYNPNFPLLLAKEIQQSCVAGVDNFLKANTDKAPGIDIEYFKCILSAITDAVEESDAEQIWAKYQDLLQDEIEQMLNCKNKVKPLEQVKCYVESVSTFISYIIKFYDELVEVNTELIRKIEQYVQQRCYNPSN